MFSDYCLMILQIIIAEHLWGTSRACIKQPQIIAVHVQDVTFSRIVQRYYLQGHETVTTEHLWWSHQIVLNNRKIMALCAQGAIPSQMFRDYYLHDCPTVTAEHLWGSHLFVSRAWKVPSDSSQNVWGIIAAVKVMHMNGSLVLSYPDRDSSIWAWGQFRVPDCMKQKCNIYASNIHIATCRPDSQVHDFTYVLGMK